MTLGPEKNLHEVLFNFQSCLSVALFLTLSLHHFHKLNSQICYLGQEWVDIEPVWSDVKQPVVQLSLSFCLPTQPDYADREGPLLLNNHNPKRMPPSRNEDKNWDKVLRLIPRNGAETLKEEATEAAGSNDASPPQTIVSLTNALTSGFAKTFLEGKPQYNKVTWQKLSKEGRLPYVNTPTSVCLPLCTTLQPEWL